MHKLYSKRTMCNTTMQIKMHLCEAHVLAMEMNVKFFTGRDFDKKNLNIYSTTHKLYPDFEQGLFQTQFELWSTYQ